MSENKLTYEEITLTNPLNTDLIKQIFEMYQFSDPLFFKIMKLNNIDINIYLKNIINKKNSSLESFFLVWSEINLVGFYNINTKNNFLYKNLQNILILKENFNNKKLSIIQKIMSDHFTLTQLPKRSLYIDKIVINKKFRSKGYGSIILKKIIMNSKYKKISLHVNKKNKKAIKFYLKNKFNIFDENKNYYSLVYDK